MTTEEFEIWFRRHMATFASLLAWFEKMPDDAPADGLVPTRTEVAKTWAWTLRDISYDEAARATDLLAGGDYPVPARNDGHPTEVKRIALEARGDRRRGQQRQKYQQSYQNGIQVYSCWRCEDRGSVVVANAEAVTEAGRVLDAGLSLDELDQHARGRLRLTAVCRCLCDAGEKFCPRLPDIPRFSEQGHYWPFRMAEFQHRGQVIEYYAFDNDPSGLLAWAATRQSQQEAF